MVNDLYTCSSFDAQFGWTLEKKTDVLYLRSFKFSLLYYAIGIYKNKENVSTI